MKQNAKLVPAIVALLVSLAMLSTSTYAWFSMNTTVFASGMNVKTTAPTNMLISTDISNWDQGATSVISVSGGYSPASTSDGTSFFALSSSDGLSVNGGIVSGGSSVQFAKVGRVDSANTYYAELALYVKASNTAAQDTDLNMTLGGFSVNTSSTTNIAKCVRISVTEVGRDTGLIGFDEAGDAFLLDGSGALTSTPATYGASTKGTTIYKYDTVTTVSPITSLSNGNVGTATLGSDTARVAGGNDICFTVDHTGEAYTTIIVRIWLEGQHENCVNAITGETISLSLDWFVKFD